MARTPIHPGEILADELKEIGISAAQLARTLGVPANRISQIIAGKRAISADTALRLARYFGTTPDLWMNLQKTYDLDLARQLLGKAIRTFRRGLPPPLRFPTEPTKTSVDIPAVLNQHSPIENWRFSQADFATISSLSGPGLLQPPGTDPLKHFPVCPGRHSASESRLARYLSPRPARSAGANHSERDSCRRL